MIQPEWFHNEVKKRGITFFTGVPDSLLKSYCNVVALQESDNHRIAANEGASVGLAAGHYLGFWRTKLGLSAKLWTGEPRKSVGLARFS